MTPARIEAAFDPEGHLYSLNGQDPPSVTQVLSAERLYGSPFWTERDRQRGSAVHSIAHLMGKRPWEGTTLDEIVANSLWDPGSTAPVLVPYGFAVADFYLKTGFRPRWTEHLVASLRFRVCGTLDQDGVVPSQENWLVEYKSGEPSEAAFVQAQIYAMCLEETEGVRPDKCVVVWLRPTGECKIFPPRPVGGIDLSIGQCAINLYHWRRKFRQL